MKKHKKGNPALQNATSNNTSNGRPDPNANRVQQFKANPEHSPKMQHLAQLQRDANAFMSQNTTTPLKEEQNSKQPVQRMIKVGGGDPPSFDDLGFGDDMALEMKFIDWKHDEEERNFETVEALKMALREAVPVQEVAPVLEQQGQENEGNQDGVDDLMARLAALGGGQVGPQEMDDFEQDDSDLLALLDDMPEAPKEKLENDGVQGQGIQEMSEEDQLLLAKIMARDQARQEALEKLPEGQHLLHTINVQGFEDMNEESSEAQEQRSQLPQEGWSDLRWAYRAGNVLSKEDLTEIEKQKHEVGGPIGVDFRATMMEWMKADDAPKWLSSLIKILDILESKNGFVAMSDIMRMVVLYYSGGMYVDMKIAVHTSPSVIFDKAPVAKNGFLLADSGMQTENWAMIAHAGSELIGQIMQESTDRLLANQETLDELPENYTKTDEDGNTIYSSEHANIHENLGPWRSIERNKEKDEVGIIPEIDDEENGRTSLVSNPRGVNSWANAQSYEELEKDGK